MNTNDFDNLKARVIAIASTTDVMKKSEGTFQPFISESETNSNLLLFQPPASERDLPLVQIYRGPTSTGLIDLGDGHSLVETIDPKRTRYYDQLKRKFNERVGVV